MFVPLFKFNFLFTQTYYTLGGQHRHIRRCAPEASTLSAVLAVYNGGIKNQKRKNETTNFARFLEIKFVEWQSREGERKTITEFADYLGVNRSLLSYWMNGSRVPSKDNLINIALILGFDVYDTLGIQRPDPDLLFISSH